MAASARGRANHGLYLARILLAAWQRDLAAESVPASTLGAAYLPAIQSHLKAAYGWFLLDIVRQEQLPETPPEGCAGLPPQPEGRVLPGEVREFAQLETSGWLHDMLGRLQVNVDSSRSPENLLSSSEGHDIRRAEQWSRSLQALFDRMSNSRDEY